MEYLASKKKSNGSTILYDFIKKKVDLAEFMETEAGCTLQWYEEGVTAGTICPMPHHKDSKPSFRIKLTDDEIWIYHCLGCGSKGTVIDFCMEYYGLDTASEAVWFLCKKFGFKKDAQLVADSLTDVKKKMNLNRRMECAHVVASNQCRVLLRRDYDGHNKWVNKAYRRMNRALEEEDIDAIENIGFEASTKMRKR